MKNRMLISVFILITFLVSCAPQTATPLPTATLTVEPTATVALTITPTPTPISMANSPDLPVWVEDYVHANGGKVIVNGVDMDAKQLTVAIRQNPEAFTLETTINGMKYSFVLVNGIPLAYQEKNGNLQEVTMAKLGEWNGVQFECSLRLDGRKYQEFTDISRITLGLTSIVAIGSNLEPVRVFKNFSESDWQRVLDDWANIEVELASGIIPTEFPYYWQDGIDAMDDDVVRAFGGNPQFRAGIYEQGVNVESLWNFQSQISELDMVKIFEFISRTTVLRFPEIKRWTVSSEVSGGYVRFKYDSSARYSDVNFWGVATGLTPAELTLLAARWVKQDNPYAKTYIVEDNIFENANPVASDTRDYFYNEYIPAIIEGNTDHIIDGIIGENNWWIYEPQDWSGISGSIEYLQANGLEIGGSETMIVSGETPINNCCGRHKLVEIQDPDLAQAEMFAQWLDLYLDKGIKTIGFGNIDDFYAWTQDVNLPDANPTFFDIDFRAKPAYYAMVRVLFEHLP